MICTAASACPLLLGFLDAHVLWSAFHSVANPVNNAFTNEGPLSVDRDSGIPCSADSPFMIGTVFVALYWDAGILQMPGIFEK